MLFKNQEFLKKRKAPMSSEFFIFTHRGFFIAVNFVFFNINNATYKQGKPIKKSPDFIKSRLPFFAEFGTLRFIFILLSVEIITL